MNKCYNGGNVDKGNGSHFEPDNGLSSKLFKGTSCLREFFFPAKMLDYRSSWGKFSYLQTILAKILDFKCLGKIVFFADNLLIPTDNFQKN